MKRPLRRGRAGRSVILSVVHHARRVKVEGPKPQVKCAADDLRLSTFNFQLSTVSYGLQIADEDHGASGLRDAAHRLDGDGNGLDGPDCGR